MKKTEEQKTQYIKNLRLMDDILMKNVFESLECTQLLLRIILNTDDLVVESVQTEYLIKSIYGRTVRLDVFARDSKGNKYNIEVQRSKASSVLKRARYNCGSVDTATTEPGEDMENLPDTYIIFILEYDLLGLGLPIYYRTSTFNHIGIGYDDGSQMIYVNQKIQDDTPLGKLMADLAQPDPSKFNYPVLADKVHDLKETEKGENKMSKELQEIINMEVEDAVEESKMESKVESIKIIMKKFGIPIDEAMETMKVPEHEYAKYRELVLNPSGMA